MLTFQLKKRLRNFSVDISEQLGAETLVLIGHSGCGKSTTLKMLSGLMSPDEGNIQLDGRVLWDGSKRIDVVPENRSIGYVFQNYALFPHLTVTDNVAYGISHLSKEERAKRVEQALEFVGIQHLSHAKPAMLSGGEQQRVALARVLVTQPKLLLLDEPLSALDVSTRSHVRAELKELLRKLSIPTIVVTHDFEDARVLADRIAVMDKGIIVQSGRQKDIQERPVNSFVAEFTGTNLLPQQADESTVQMVAFDPWSAEVSGRPSALRYEWKGTIRDISWLGGFVRLHIQGIASWLADVSIDKFEQSMFQVGDTVYTSVSEADARVVSVMQGSLERFGRQPNAPSTEPKPRSNTKRWKIGVAALAAIAVIASVTGYSYSKKNMEAAAKKGLIAFVAANATDPFNDTIKMFEEKHPQVNLDATYAGTQVLRTQLEQGAKADLFLSADITHIEAVKKEGLISEFYPVSQTHEVIVVPKNNPAGIHSLQDLGSKKTKLIIGTDSVPIGRYTRMVFEKANQGYGQQFSKNVNSHVVSLETNVKQVLQKVSMGEADAGVVYRTDVTASFADKVQVVEIPPEYNVEAINYIAVPKDASNPELGKELMDFMLSPDGQAIFAKYKYEIVKQ